MKSEKVIKTPLSPPKPAEVDEEALQQQVVGSTPYHFDLPRRDFFKLVGGGIVVGVALKQGVAQETGGQRRGGGEQMPDDVSVWVHVSEKGDVTVFTGKIEVGQNARTSLTQ